MSPAGDGSMKALLMVSRIAVKPGWGKGNGERRLTRRRRNAERRGTEPGSEFPVFSRQISRVTFHLPTVVPIRPWSPARAGKHPSRAVRPDGARGPGDRG